MRGVYKVLLSIACLSIGIGLIIGIVAVAVGVSERNITVGNSDFSEKLEEADSLLLDVSYGDVRITEGDCFSISVNNTAEDGIDSFIQDGTWIIRESSSDGGSIKLFGRNIHISAGLFGISSDIIPHINITIPKGCELDDVNILLDSGKLNAERILCKNLTLEVGAGDVYVDELKVLDKSEYHVGAGQMVIDDIEAEGDVYMNCGAGYMSVEGVIHGDGSVDCGVGAVDVSLNGDEDDYSFTVEGGIGGIDINGSKYWGINPNGANKKYDALYDFNVACTIGKVKFRFN